MRFDTSCEQANFILDGDQYFLALHRLICAVEGQGRGASIRLAYWKADPSVILPAVAGRAPRTLAEALVAAARAGARVQVILWNGWKSECFVPHHHFWRLDWSEFVNKWRNILTQWTFPEGSLEFKYHSYAGSKLHPFTSLHVKIAMFETAQRKDVLLGGMNLGEDYKSAARHDVQNHWHDAAVAMSGDIYRVVEHYWSELWVGNKPTPPNTPDRTGGPTPVTFVTTDVQGDSAERHIRKELLYYIQRAKRYIYMENQALTDPAIIDALAVAATRNVQVIIVVPHPRETVMGDYSGYAYVMNYAFRAIAMAQMTQFSYPGTVYGTHTVHNNDILESSLRYEGWILSGRAIQTKSPSLPAARDAANDKYINELEKALRNGDDALMRSWRDPNLPFRPASQFMNRGFHWKTTQAWVGTWVYLEKMTDIQSTSFCMYAPRVMNHQHGQSPYVHSKIALIDDEVAFVGSSNWTYRSMQFDAEVSAVIQDAGFVRATREELFTHWRMPTDITQWRATALNNAALNDGTVRIVPLTLADFQVSYLSLTAWGSWAAGNMI